MKKIILPLFLSLTFTVPLSTVFARDADTQIEDLERQLKILKLEREIAQLRGTTTQQPLDSSSEQSDEQNSTQTAFSQPSNGDAVQTNEASTTQTTQQTMSINALVFPQEWRATPKFSALLSRESVISNISQQLNIQFDETSYNRTQSCAAQRGKSLPSHISNASNDSFLLFTAIMNGGQWLHKMDGVQYVADLVLEQIITKQNLEDMSYGPYFNEISAKMGQIKRNKAGKKFADSIDGFIRSFNNL